MEKIKQKGFRGLIWALLLALVIAVIVDAAAVIFWNPLPRLPWLIGTGALFVLFALLPVSRQGLRGEFFTLLGLLLLALLFSRGLLLFLERSGAYPAKDEGKSALFGKQRVLVVVPREGDELRLAAGVLEGFTHYGSELSLFYTEDSGEAVIAAALGVPASRVYEGGALEAALAELDPTLVLAAKDEQYALKAALHTLDRTPPVLYGLLWTEEADFYAENLLSSLDPGWYARSGLTWDRRLRLPVEPATLSHALSGCSDYKLLKKLGLEDEAESLISGDRVFWALETVKPLSFVKLANSDGDFIYDYYIDVRGREGFPLYTVGEADQPYSVTVEGQSCAAKITQGRVLEVSCPKGRSCVVTVTSADGKYSDTVRISNAGRFSRETAHSMERFLRGLWETSLPRMNTVSIAALVLSFARAL